MSTSVYSESGAYEEYVTKLWISGSDADAPFRVGSW